jgi:hypothetical protein
MSPDRIKTFLSEEPFKPFTVCTGDGASVNVLSKEFAWLRPGGRTLIVAEPLKEKATEENEFREHNIDVFLITKVITPPDRTNGKRRKRTR